MFVFVSSPFLFLRLPPGPLRLLLTPPAAALHRDDLVTASCASSGLLRDYTRRRGVSPYSSEHFYWSETVFVLLTGHLSFIFITESWTVDIFLLTQSQTFKPLFFCF